MGIYKNMIEVSGLEVNYDSLQVLKNVTFSLERGEILGVIGQNGSGKSTLLKAMFSIVKPAKGIIRYEGHDAVTLSPDQIRKLGIAYCLQGGVIFPNLTVWEHLLLADPKIKRINYAYNVFPEIKEMIHQRAGNLSGGQRQVISLAMLLIQDARIWLLDEPSAGLSPANASKTMEFIKQTNLSQSITMLIVEHNHDFVFELSDFIINVNNNTCSEKLPKSTFMSTSSDLHEYN